ncbi:putative histidine kinase [Janibacter sp. HTCC2649]|uniref:sensor histidine kinase n=1 Tax=Janibacter sp. HTCC2649 TaxID=313589 RepID=UPI0000670BC8|nr:sensor histidine kinase [Janibacter sp. HTCC2649]EAP99679.1 putative histidine kinase [Janibacter sp. HTCC2649]
MTEPVTAEETPPHDIPWYSIDEWSLRRKLALALAIPVLLAATFGGLRVTSATSEAQSFSRLESKVAVLQPAVRLVDSSSAVAVAGRSTDEAAVNRARATLDTAVKDVRSVMRTAGLSDEQVTALDQAVASAQTVRNSTATVPAETVADQFAEVVAPVTVVLGELTSETSDTRLTSVRDVLAGQLALTKQRLLTAKTGATVDQIALGNAIGEEATAIASLAGNLGANDTFVDALLTGNELRLAAAPTVSQGTAALPREREAVSVYTTLAKQINGQVVDTMREKASEGRRAAIRDAVATIGLLVAAIALALAVARLLLDPITRVRLGALDVAHERLPTALRQIRAGEEPAAIEPLPVHTGEEVGQLARAVDVLHAEAIFLATQQARLREQVSAMFETLSRRSTSLINQQLGLIENLERDEDDPRRLENLFRLDHLAARIRRNGESLLVLAGAAPRSGAGQDLPLGDVVRAAVSEVQDYQRVRLAVSDLVIQAGAAPNLIHLFAELIDNALSYSPPDSTVTVASVRGVDGGTLVEVSDDGLGMTPEAVASANESLVTGGEVTTETARRMGLYVVGQLAIRHDVTVRIRPNPESTGTIVSVFLPAALLASGRGATTAPAAKTGEVSTADVAGRAGVEGTAEGADPAYTGSATPMGSGLPRLGNLTAVPNLDSTIDERSQQGGLGGAASTATPTTLPHMSVVPPVAPQAPRATGSGLPRRQPGAAGGPGSTPPRPAWANGSSASSSGAPSAPDAPTPSATPDPTREPETASPAALHDPAEQQETSGEPVVSRQPQSIRDLVPAPVAETPIFRQLQTSWLSDTDNADLPWASDEIDQGWQAAERAVSAESAGRSRSGLPMRRPGSTLVPGQVGQGANSAVARDPEAIRAHLNRHLAGVRRGRASSGTGDAQGTNESRSASNSGSTLLDEERDRS